MHFEGANNGFIQLITRATRIQGNHFSLIDHILSNTVNTNTKSGVLVSDINDHFITFMSPSYTKISRKQTTCTARNFSKQNIEIFKLSLRAHSWNTTYSSNSFFSVQYSALLHLLPLRFHCADGCWDRTQDRCNWCIGRQTL